MTFHSCNFLTVDDYFNETLKYDSIFTTTRNTERYLWATAGMLPEEGNFFSGFGSFASDEGFALTNDFAGMQYTLGNITPTNIGGSMAKWNTMYVIIRRANTILANLDKAADMTALDRRDILAFTYFLRAYAYYQLLMQYGPIVIMGDDVLETNEGTEYYDRARATFDESVDYICEELERAATYLPNAVSVSLFGRPTRGAAWGLITRLRLIQASPLWNGGDAARRTFGYWRRSTDQVHYVSQTSDEKKWATAAAASWRIIESGNYRLHTVPKMDDTYAIPANVPRGDFPLGAGNIDPFRSYSDMFTGEALVVRNPEYLWANWSTSLVNFGRFSFPVTPLNGWNSISIPQKIINAYRMADGRTIENSSSEYPYSQTGFMGGVNITFSGYRLNGTASNMYVNREMRFYASIGFSQAFWPCNSTANANLRNQTLTYYLDGNAGVRSTNNNPFNYPVTGYTLRKYVHEDDSWGDVFSIGSDGARRIPKAYPVIRYAEILLSYVEALNNLTTDHTEVYNSENSKTFRRDTDEMKYYFNMVRFRAGLPGLTDEELASRQTMQELIERERMVELLFENIRYFDIRRWGIFEQAESEPIMGMDTEATRNGGYYNIVPVNHARARNRVSDRRLILYPIELNEVRKAPSMDQNPGYQF
jgi:hypothetical protein